MVLDNQMRVDSRADVVAITLPASPHMPPSGSMSSAAWARTASPCSDRSRTPASVHQRARGLEGLVVGGNARLPGAPSGAPGAERRSARHGDGGVLAGQSLGAAA